MAPHPQGVLACCIAMRAWRLPADVDARAGRVVAPLAIVAIVHAAQQPCCRVTRRPRAAIRTSLPSGNAYNARDRSTYLQHPRRRRSLLLGKRSVSCRARRFHLTPLPWEGTLDRERAYMPKPALVPAVLMLTFGIAEAGGAIPWGTAMVIGLSADGKSRWPDHATSVRGCC